MLLSFQLEDWLSCKSHLDFWSQPNARQELSTLFRGCETVFMRSKFLFVHVMNFQEHKQGHWNMAQTG